MIGGGYDHRVNASGEFHPRRTGRRVREDRQMMNDKFIGKLIGSFIVALLASAILYCLLWLMIEWGLL